MTNPKQTDEPIEFRMGAFKDLVNLTTGFGYLNMRDDVIAQVEGAMKQAREDAFNVVRDALREKGDDDHWTFVQYCLTGAIESGHAGSWMVVTEYDAGLSDFELETLPGMDRTKERRAATVTLIESGDDYLDQTAVDMILASGKACKHCGAALSQVDGTWVDRTNAYACPSHDAEHEPEQVLFKVTHETIELGLQRIRHATDAPDEGPHPEQRGLTSVKHLSRHQRNRILRADLTNEAGMLDVLDYLAILEIALFGEVRYA